MSSQQPSSVICLPEEEEEKNQIKTRIVIKPIKRYAYMLCVCVLKYFRERRTMIGGS